MGRSGLIQLSNDTASDDSRLSRKRRPTLVDSACQHIRGSIVSGERGPGSRLPSEAEIGDVLRVSRTVVREAIARLAAEGLVEPRHGKGVFVSETARYQAFQITRDELDSLHDVIQLLELRLSVETEMASLAAERRTEVDVMNLRRQLSILSETEGGTDDSVRADVEFHRIIAQASSNIYYLKLIDFLGVRLVPPRSLYLRQDGARTNARYVATISAEHNAILDAIAGRDPHAARLAARTHMSESLRRHRELKDIVSGDDGAAHDRRA